MRRRPGARTRGSGRPYQGEILVGRIAGTQEADDLLAVARARVAEAEDAEDELGERAELSGCRFQGSDPLPRRRQLVARRVSLAELDEPLPDVEFQERLRVDR